MALRSAHDFSCPICFDIFKNPVVLSCSHSFCKDCLQHWWAEKLIHECPVCKRRSSRTDPPCNLALKNLCEAFLQDLSLQGKPSAGSEALCSQHSEKFRLFCLDHEQPVCVVCRDSNAHINHRFRPIDEAALENRVRLRTSLKVLQKDLKHFKQVKADWDQTAEHIKVQAQQTEKQIKDNFKNLHNFLHKEEKVRISALRKEEVQKQQMMKKKIETLSKNIAALSETIRATEEELRAEDVSLLKNIKAALDRFQERPLVEDPQLASGALIDVAKHVGNLAFNIWNKMKDMISYSSVILDPNTAHPNIILSDDLTSVRYTAETDVQRLRNPERFAKYVVVCGSEGFNSGTHSWDVDIKNDADWSVGVIEESVPRKKEILAGYWEIMFKDGEYKAYAPSYTDTVLSVKTPIQRIRVQLDWSRGQLSFFDLDTNTNLYTFSHTFTERLFPFVNSEQPLRILPQHPDSLITKPCCCYRCCMCFSFDQRSVFSDVQPANFATDHFK